MNPLWPPETSRAQKWMVSIFVLVSLGTVPPILSRSFVPSSQWQFHAFDIALSITAAGCAWLWWLYFRKQWRPAGPWQTYSPIKRLLIAPMCVAYFIFALWVNVVTTFPLLYTAAFGTEAVQPASASKARGTGRYSCHYQLKVPDIKYVLFEFCIDEDAFDAAPKGLYPAELSVRQSYFGYQVHTIMLNNTRSASTHVFTGDRVPLRLPRALTKWLSSDEP